MKGKNKIFAFAICVEKFNTKSKFRLSHFPHIKRNQLSSLITNFQVDLNRTFSVSTSEGRAEMKTDTLKFQLKGGLKDEGWIDGDGKEVKGKLENLVCAIRKSPSSLKYHLTHCFVQERWENKTKKPNSNILNDFYDFSFSRFIFLCLKVSLSHSPILPSVFYTLSHISVLSQRQVSLYIKKFVLMSKQLPPLESNIF